MKELSFQFIFTQIGMLQFCNSYLSKLFSFSSSSSTSKKSRTSSQSSSAETYQSEKLTKSLSKMGDDLSTPCSCEQDCLDRFTIAELKRARIKYHSFNRGC